MTNNLQTLIRIHRWRLDERRKKVAELEGLRGEFESRSRALEDEVRREQSHAAKDAGAAVTYGAYVAGVIRRRETIRYSIDEIDAKLDAAKREVAEAFRELKKFEIAEDRERRRQARRQARRERAVLDEVGLNLYRRRRQAGGLDGSAG